MKLFSLLLIFLFSWTFLSFVSAGSFGCSATDSDAVSFLSNCGAGTIGIDPDGGSGQEGVRDRVTLIAQSAITLGSVLAVAFLVWAGIQYTTAYGDDEKIKHAKQTGIYALVGLILLMAAFGLVDIFIGFINQFLSL